MLFLCNIVNFFLFSQAVDVKPGLIRTNGLIDVNGGTISKNEF